MGRELEWKYRTDAPQLEALARKYGPFTLISMETTYYDTQDLKLAFHHWTLRRRMENGQAICTCKTPLEDGSRGEWEIPCASIMEAVPLLCQAGAPWELMRCTAGGVYPLCGARFTRQAATVSLSGCTLELALDQGVLLGRGQELPFQEVEVELKSGDEAQARSFAQDLAADYALRPEPLSKFQRAMALALQG